MSTAAATAPAVEVRSTDSPSRADVAPALVNAVSSSGLIPPSGPTIRTMSPLTGSGGGDIFSGPGTSGWDAVGWGPVGWGPVGWGPVGWDPVRWARASSDKAS